MENQKHFGDGLISALRGAASELESLQVKVEHGKEKASDKFDEVKSKFNTVIHDAKSKLDAGEDKLNEKYNELKGKLEHLEVQVALGKAEAKDIFDEQKKKISHAIHDIENYVSSKF